jgi:hypothetical protein
VGIPSNVMEQERLIPVMVNIKMEPTGDPKTKPESLDARAFGRRESMAMLSRVEAPPIYIPPTCSGA